MVDSSDQIFPPLAECQIGASAPHPAVKARMSISLGLLGLIAMLGSPLGDRLVFFRVLSVLLTITSLITMPFAIPPTPRISGGRANSPPGTMSSGRASRLY